MFEFIKGVICDIDSGYITIFLNNIGYKIYVSNPYSFNMDEEYKIYLYQHITEDENTLFGFKSKEERNFFLKLISVKGLGPKMALSILASGSLEGIIDAIERENILYLKKFPKIGDKIARQIILDLKGNLVSKNDEKSNIDNDLVDALKSLGYRSSDINRVIKNISNDLSIEDKVKEALKLLLK